MHLGQPPCTRMEGLSPLGETDPILVPMMCVPCQSVSSCVSPSCDISEFCSGPAVGGTTSFSHPLVPSFTHPTLHSPTRPFTHLFSKYVFTMTTQPALRNHSAQSGEWLVLQELGPVVDGLMAPRDDRSSPWNLGLSLCVPSENFQQGTLVLHRLVCAGHISV